jgi:hypothetical protein
MTINEVGELSTTLLISLGMFVVGVYLICVMFGAFNMSRKKETSAKAINKYLLRHLVVHPLVVLAVAAFIVFITYLAALLQVQAIFELYKLANW